MNHQADDHLETLVRHTDQAVVQAKQQGRTGIDVVTSLPRSEAETV